MMKYLVYFDGIWNCLIMLAYKEYVLMVHDLISFSTGHTTWHLGTSLMLFAGNKCIQIILEA